MRIFATTKSTTMNDPKGFLLKATNPFAADWRNTITGTKTRTTIFDLPSPAAEETLTHTSKYTPSGKWCKIYQNKEVLSDLSPGACRLLIAVSLELEYNMERVQMTQRIAKMGNHAYPAAIKELTDKGILSKDKRGWYWVNPTILGRGKVSGIEGE